MRTEAAALLGKVGTQWLLFFMSLSYSSGRICSGSDVGPLWSQGLEGSSVSRV